MAEELQTVQENEQQQEDNLGAEALQNKKKTGLPFGLDAKNVTLIVVAVTTITALLFQTILAPKYNLLYSELEQSDAAAISSYLEKKGIKFKISPDGSKISVANNSIPKLRLELADKGLPRGTGVGFEIFDKTNLNISDFNQKINYSRALEGELARTISSLSSIKTAKVHLALAKKSIFRNSDETNKASVIVTTTFGGRLSETQIKSIQHLVASAVQGLDASNVQITDQEGNSLVKFTDAKSLKQEQVNHNEQKIKDFEAKLESELLEMLSPILGKGNVLVNVTTEMNFDESEVNIELFNPKDPNGKKHEPVIRSEKVISEKYKNGKSTSFGTGGSQHSIPSFVEGGRNMQEGSSGKDYVKEDKTKNYEISKSIERIRKATGLVKKISVAVVVNKDLHTSERNTLRQTVQVAAGLDLERGDQVIVTGIKFSSTPYTSLTSQREQKTQVRAVLVAKIKKYISIAITAIFGIVVMMIIMMSLSAGVDDNRAREIDNLLQEENIPLLSSIDEKIQEAEEAYHRQLSLEGNKTVESMKRDLSQMAIEDPKGMAKSLHAYIND